MTASKGFINQTRQPGQVNIKPRATDLVIALDYVAFIPTLATA